MIFREQNEKGQYALTAYEIWKLLRDSPSLSLQFHDKSDSKCSKMIGSMMRGFIRKKKDVLFMAAAVVEKCQYYSLKVTGN